MEIQNIIENGGAWEYVSDVNKWRYNKLNADGTTTVLKDGAYAMPALDGIYYYIFDEEFLKIFDLILLNPMGYG